MTVIQSRERGVCMSIGTERVALVTGASGGIGAAAAGALLRTGFTVYGTSRTAAAGETRDGVVFLPLDVTEDLSVAGAVGEVLERSGRIDVLVNNAGIGFAPQPFMASYVASKHAVEGYSESVDHEVRERGVRILLVEPFNTSTGFDASVVRGENPLPVYERGRQIFDAILAEGMKTGNDPAVIAKVILAAATDPRPKLRYPAGSGAGRVSMLRRLVPARIFDKQIRKINRMT